MIRGINDSYLTPPKKLVRDGDVHDKRPLSCVSVQRAQMKWPPSLIPECLLSEAF